MVNTGIYSIHDDGNKVIEDENGNEIVVNGNDGAFWIELRILRTQSQNNDSNEPKHIPTRIR